MGDLSKNLSRSEFACQCGCGFDTADFVLVNVLQSAVSYFEDFFGTKVQIQITGGNRCRRHNNNLRKQYVESGGKKGAKTALNSKHIYAIAADHKFWIIHEDGSKEQVDPDFVHSYYTSTYPDKFGIGKYHNRTHIDSRMNKARWG